MSRRDYLGMADVLAMHEVLITRYGGSRGLRDAGALESAIHRPRSGYYEDAIAEAAALFESLLMNHPFVDGNKRVAFAALDTFLRINGYRLQGEPMAVHAELMAMFEQHATDFEHLAGWIRAHVVAA